MSDTTASDFYADEKHHVWALVTEGGHVIRCNISLPEAERLMIESRNHLGCRIVNQRTLDAGRGELAAFAHYLLQRASESKVYRDKAAKEWRYSCAQEHQVAIDIYEELADFILSGDAKKELPCPTT